MWNEGESRIPLITFAIVTLDTGIVVKQDWILTDRAFSFF